MFTGLSFTILNAQYFNGVAITAVDSGNGTNNILFSATSSTIPLLAKIRAQVISGSGKFTWNGDNFRFTSSVFESASGIPNNKSQIQITFLQSNGTTLIPASDLRFIISDLDGPDNEAIAVGCSSGLKFFGTSPNSNITLTNDSEIRGTGTANQNFEPSSTVILEFSKQNTIIIDTYGNKDFYKEFDLNNNDYALSTTLYTQCNSLDNDGDGITNKNDLDDDNDGILDTAESGIYNPEGDADGDGLPNYLDIVNNAGQSSFFSPDGSSTSYTDANNNGIPDVYDLDGDGLPNHLDTDSDGDGCPDAIEGGDNITKTMLNGSNAIGSNISGTLNSPAIATVDAYGVPVITNTGSTFNVDGQAHGQTAGSAYTSNPAAVAGTASYSQTICWNTAPSAITLTGSIGTIQWQSSTDNVTFTNISGATSATYAPGALTATTYYRAVLTSAGGCTANSTTVTINIDSDGDGVIDSNDLDDDNDGILDTTENPCTSAQVQWMHNASSGQSDFATFGNDTTTTSPHFTSADNISFGAGLDETTDNYAYTYLLRNATATTFADAKTGNDYAQVSYTPSKKMYLNGINFGYFSSTGSPQVNCGNFKMAVEYSTSAAFTSPIVLLQDIQVGAMVSGGYTTVNNAISKLLLQSGTTYYFRVYFYDEQNTDPNNRVRLDDLYFPHCLFVDTDNDGIEDYLDLDSDNDGCPDVIEGGANFTSGASYITNNALNTIVNSSGVPAVPSATPAITGYDQTNGQTVNQAYTVNPTAVGGTASSNQTICWNTTPTALTLSGSTGSIQWQSSTDNVTFNNISGATSATYAPGALTATTYYRAILTSAGGCTATSTTVTITVNNCIDAVNDTYASVTPGTSTTSVITNDKNNSGTAAVIGTGAGQVSIRTSTDAAGTAGAWPTGFTLNADGTITVAAGTAAGSYTLYYTICNQTAGTPCDTAAVTITVFIPFCYKPAQTSGTILDTNHGITALGRAGEHDADGNLTNDWPMVRKGAWTVLEAKTKGFVVNRLTDAQITAIPSADLREGMMVYNITQDCLQINIDGTSTGWRCFNTQTCPD